jgi:hypothetical protein
VSPIQPIESACHLHPWDPGQNRTPRPGNRNATSNSGKVRRLKTKAFNSILSPSSAHPLGEPSSGDVGTRHSSTTIGFVLTEIVSGFGKIEYMINISSNYDVLEIR